MQTVIVSIMTKPCRVAPPLQPKHREGSTGVRIKLAEKDQRILESQEYIQVRKLRSFNLRSLTGIIVHSLIYCMAGNFVGC